MRISDWSSDVCSSDLSTAAHGTELRPGLPLIQLRTATGQNDFRIAGEHGFDADLGRRPGQIGENVLPTTKLDRFAEDRKSVVLGKRLSVGVDPGVRGILKKKTTKKKKTKHKYN